MSAFQFRINKICYMKISKEVNKNIIISIFRSIPLFVAFSRAVFVIDKSVKKRPKKCRKTPRNSIHKCYTTQMFMCIGQILNNGKFLKK